MKAAQIRIADGLELVKLPVKQAEDIDILLHWFPSRKGVGVSELKVPVKLSETLFSLTTPKRLATWVQKHLGQFADLGFLACRKSGGH